MDAFRFLLLLAFLFDVVAPQSILRVPAEEPELKLLDRAGDRDERNDERLYCESWRFTVETNDAGIWTQVPEKCVGFVQDYMTRGRYQSDCTMVSLDSLSFATGIEIFGDGKDAWIFDIDETLLSNLPYFAAHGFGFQVFNETSYYEWVALADAPAIPPSLNLYEELQKLGFKLILLTGRTEFQRNATSENLLCLIQELGEAYLKGSP